ncbi:pyridoxamine 5'-phosphate oxidase family protein [Actinopolyspora mzabensis]|nr:pyridoxamine 5'-phosphate oxidase family protein [Actinopolyspora mzabensis]
MDDPTGSAGYGGSESEQLEVTDEENLRELLGTPLRRTLDKERGRLHGLDRQWLAHSPFCLVATSDELGNCDVSPKGDPPGFTLVLDDSTIALPERPGNRRADNFRNILRNPHVGLLYMLPGRGDTLRINGRARIVRRAPFFERMEVKGHRPGLALVVEIEQVFHHCAKVFMRSGLWNPESWNPEAVDSRPAIAKALETPEKSLAELEGYYGAEYAAKLYG